MITKSKLTADQKDILSNIIKKEGDKQEIKRAQAILLIDKKGSRGLIEEMTGYSISYAFDLRKIYIEKGISGIKSREKKTRSFLTKNQLLEVAKVLEYSTPKDFGFNSDFWTTTILSSLIKEQYSVVYKSKTSLQLIFKKSKFTYHKPGKKYEKRDETLINEWKNEKLPILKELVDNPNTHVLAEDEMILSTQTTFQKIWLPEGAYPQIEVSNTRRNRSIYGFLNVKTGQQHAFKTEKQNGENTVKILRKILSLYPDKKIVIVWDNAPWHKNNYVKNFLSTLPKNRILLISFPPYAPDLNPQEHVWKTARSAITHNKFIQSIDKASDEFINFLNNSIFKYNFFNLVGF